MFLDIHVHLHVFLDIHVQLCSIFNLHISNVSHFLYDSYHAGCLDTFTAFERRSSNGATLDSSADTVDECTSLCRAQDDCAGFDYNTVSNDCWLHTDSNNFNTFISNNDVTQYVKQKCTGTRS